MHRATFSILIALLCQGCLSLPDTFDDMWHKLDSVAVPDDFTLIGKRQKGRRTPLAAPEPTVAATYSAPWDGGDLCERLRDLLSKDSSVVRETRSGTCGYEASVSSGWKAKLVNVWTYELRAYARDPELTTTSTSDWCAQIRKRHEEENGADYYHGRVEECWVESGESLVSIAVRH